MSDWDFLWDEDRSPEEINEAISSGATAEEWELIEKQLNNEELRSTAKHQVQKGIRLTAKQMNKEK